MNDNLKYWNQVNQPPRSALKEIAAGRLKGKSDINPQWRYKAMTETFGIVGIGWKFTIDKMWNEPAANNETLCFVNVSVYIKDGDKWSDAIPGNGGSTLVANEKSGLHNSDDAYKMAVTDALSTAMKMLGVAADIYMGLWDGAKYKDTSPKVETSRSDLVTRYNLLVTKAIAAKLANIPELTADMTEEQITATGISLSERIKKEGK